MTALLSTALRHVGTSLRKSSNPSLMFWRLFCSDTMCACLLEGEAPNDKFWESKATEGELSELLCRASLSAAIGAACKLSVLLPSSLEGLIEGMLEFGELFSFLWLLSLPTVLSLPLRLRLLSLWESSTSLSFLHGKFKSLLYYWCYIHTSVVSIFEFEIPILCKGLSYDNAHSSKVIGWEALPKIWSLKILKYFLSINLLNCNVFNSFPFQLWASLIICDLEQGQEINKWLSNCIIHQCLEI